MVSIDYPLIWHGLNIIWQYVCQYHDEDKCKNWAANSNILRCLTMNVDMDPGLLIVRTIIGNHMMRLNSPKFGLIIALIQRYECISKLHKIGVCFLYVGIIKYYFNAEVEILEKVKYPAHIPACIPYIPPMHPSSYPTHTHSSSDGYQSNRWATSGGGFLRTIRMSKTRFTYGLFQNKSTRRPHMKQESRHHCCCLVLLSAKQNDWTYREQFLYIIIYIITQLLSLSYNVLLKSRGKHWEWYLNVRKRSYPTLADQTTKDAESLKPSNSRNSNNLRRWNYKNSRQ